MITQLAEDHWDVHGVPVRRAPDGTHIVLWKFGKQSSRHASLDAATAAVEAVVDIED